MLFHRNGDEHERDLLFERALVIEKFYNVVSLHGLDRHAERAGDVDTLFDDALGDAAGIFPHGDLAECAARDGGEPREGAVDEQFRPARADKVMLDHDRTHAFEEFFRLFEAVSPAVSAQRESERGGLGSEFGDAAAVEGRTPRNGTAERAVGADDLGDPGFGEPVLAGAKRAVRLEVIFQKAHDLRVVLLFRHEQDDIVLARHFFGEERVDLLREPHRTDDLCAVAPERLDVRPVAVDKIDLHARPCDVCAEHRTQCTCAVNGISHTCTSFYCDIPLSADSFSSRGGRVMR